MEREIGLSDVWKIIRSHLKFIFIITFFFTLISGLLSFFVLPPKYEAEASLYVQTYKTENPFNDVMANQKQLKMYGDIIKSREIADEVIKELNLKITAEELLEKVTVNPVKDSLVISIRATDQNYKQAVTIANGFAEVFKDKLPSIMKVNKVKVFNKAVEEPNAEPVSPNPYKNMAIALALGLMISIAIVLLKDFLDKSIKTEKEIETLFEVPVLGVITNFEKEKKVKMR